jgi:D-serine deaminase-like pyridoxal phosphate-dependent protein
VSSIQDLRTPALVLDRGVLARNLESMARRLQGLGVALRPHMKTAKCAEIAALAVRGQPGGITVSTLKEAAYFAGGGFRDITYAVGISPDKLDEVASLRRQDVELRILVDDAGVAREVAARGRRLGTTFPTLIEVDTGAHRGGVDPEGPELLEIARVLGGKGGARLDGVLTHAGHAYACRSVEEIRSVATEERAGVVRAAERLGCLGLDCPTVSAGSTPTAVHAPALDGVTEMRPGNYMFFDLFQEGLGTCRREDIAISVLATVIGHCPRHRRILIDAGALALSLDTSACRFSEDIGYGVVVDASGAEVVPGLHVARVHQEHGFVEAREPLPFHRLPIGSRVRILPGHACITAAMFDRYHVTEDGERVVDTWSRVSGW